MTREIKFRAWDSKNKKFPFVGFNLFGEVTMFDLLKQYTLQESIDNLEFSQFTGLTDKNGKEIYEGDILISKYGDKKPFEILFGEHQTYQEKVGSKSTSIGFYWNETDGEQVGFGKSIDGNMDAYEVIGNVFENPELI